tara:strand:- start:1049 stop:1579 length:531 start_codon:yes stop_codon:yes gene_type:complete
MSSGPQILGLGRPALPVEITEEAYKDGRKFRTFFDFSDSTFPLVIKFDITNEIDLTLASQSIYDGSMWYRVFAGGVESGTFTPIPQFSLNNKDGVPTVDSGMVVSVGGTVDITGLSPIDETYLKTANGSNRATTVPSGTSSSRGFPITTAYVVIDAISGSADPKGLVKYEWSPVIP